MSTPERTGFWAGLSPRERVLILAMVLTFFVMGTLVLAYLRAEALRSTRERIESHAMALDKVYTQGAIYQEILAKRKAAEADISTDELQFSTLLEKAQSGRSEGFTVEDIDEAPAQDLGNGLLKRTLEFRLRSVKYKDAIEFLTTIESEPNRVIFTEELSIKSPNDDSDAVNFDVTISTWERREVGESGDDDDDDETKGSKRGRKRNAKKDES